MARVLILRAEGAAADTVALLRAAGHEPLHLPVDEIVPLDPAPPALDEIGAVVATSRNAVLWMARHLSRDLPVVAVGERTAEALRAAGFGDVAVGAGTAGAELLERCTATGAILYPAGRVRTDAIERAARTSGRRLHVVEVYDTRALGTSRSAIAAVLGGRPPNAALVLSGGQATGLWRLYERAPDLIGPTERIVCNSARVAAALNAPFRDRATVATNRELIASLDRL